MGLVERFEQLASCRRRVLGETQQRIRRLGDIVTRVGVSRRQKGGVGAMVEKSHRRRRERGKRRVRGKGE